MNRRSCAVLIWILIIVVWATVSPAATGQSGVRSIAPATVVMSFPEALGAMERPAVEFDHAAHTTALAAEGCETCHRVDETGLSPKLTATLELTDRERLIDAYHDACMSCHTQRAEAALKSGPVTCGECHVRRPQGVSERAAMAFDYSLHARHAQAYPEKCETCHHDYDEEQQKLVYLKGTEEACRSCHGPVDVEKTPSLANAAHQDCVGCHLELAQNEKEAGPVLCVGCHDAAQQDAIEQLEEVPRLVRGQPDTVWITADEARSQAVAFNHLAHEPLTGSCSTCHHQTLKACTECHTLAGSEEGAGVTMEQSYHARSSEHSCVGCHASTTSDTSCSGCHRALGQAANERACAVCHSGPRPGFNPDEIPPPTPTEARLAALPAPSDDFPENIEIAGIADLYEPSKFPHAKIVAKLDAAVRESSLAGRFHGSTDTLCAGCHHQSPAGTRPPPCRACHGDSGEATIDKPALKVAYHRQCVGCHIEMGLEKQGCTDCHAAREDQS
jgi:hypothetical protein